MKNRFYLIIASIALCASLLGCSSGGEPGVGGPDYDAKMEAADNAVIEYPPMPSAAPEYAPIAQEKADGFAGDGVSFQNINTEVQKIIRNASLEMESKDFDSTLNAINQAIATAGGYIQSSSVNGQKYADRSATITARIPADKLESFLKQVGNVGGILSQLISTEDVSGQYFDSQARKNSLQIQLARLEAIMAQSAKLEDILKLETEISRVRYEIESLESNLKRWDNLVSYSTVNISLYSVKENEILKSEPQSFGARVSTAFKSSISGTGEFLKELVILIARLIPMLLVLAVIAVIVIFILKKRKKKAETRMIEKRNDAQIFEKKPENIDKKPNNNEK